MIDGGGRSQDKYRQSVNIPDEMLQEITLEAGRLDRSLSWVVRQAWMIAREAIKKLPSTER